MRTILRARICAARIGAAALIGGAFGLALTGPAAAMQAEKSSAPISVTSGTIVYTATATYSDGRTSSDRIYRVMLDPDSDGDGLDDQMWLRVTCAEGAITAAYTVKAPRDVATGQSSGKRSKTSEAEVNLRGQEGPFKGSIAGTPLWDRIDPATGLPTGKRQHGTVTIHKEMSRSAITGQRVSWDLVKAKGNKTMAVDDWHKRTIRDGAANLCV